MQINDAFAVFYCHPVARVVAEFLLPVRLALLLWVADAVPRLRYASQSVQCCGIADVSARGAQQYRAQAWHFPSRKWVRGNSNQAFHNSNSYSRKLDTGGDA
jgi:hypothetical protein